METVQPYATMMDVKSRIDGVALLKKVEWIARISHRSEEAQTSDSWERFITSVVLNHGDWSTTEHASVTVDVVVDRGITHEWVRHRLGAYTQESTRFVNLAKKELLRFVEPSFGSSRGKPNDMWADVVSKCEETYRELLACDISPQIARSVLPSALASRLICTFNLRMWRHFFLMRTSKESHPQMREVTIPLLAQFKECIPLLYDDIEPLAKQSDNLRKPR